MAHVASQAVLAWQAQNVNSTEFEDLRAADLAIDRTYRGGKAGNRGDDPISKLLRVGNAGGFRFQGSPTRNLVRCLALYTSGADPDWPDRLDLSDGTFTYYGDNKRPGKELHDTPRKGNLALRRLFDDAQTPQGRLNVPPVMLFAKAGQGTDVVFRGLLVPGSPTMPIDEQLVAIWRSSGSERFQNYRATFSVLNVPIVSRLWIEQIEAGTPDSSAAPAPWLNWLRTGLPARLLAPRSIIHRTREQQLPESRSDMEMLAAIHSHFAADPHRFEEFAAQIWLMMAPATDELEVTRRSRDGGRDAIGRYRIGPPTDPIRIDFALEAKCYAPQASVGVREVSRLISRLRHRNFGVLVTTSFVNQQAYREIRDDQHPVAIVSGADIVALLKQRGWGSRQAVQIWLSTDFPVGAGVADVRYDDPLVEAPDIEQVAKRTSSAGR